MFMGKINAERQVTLARFVSRDLKSVAYTITRFRLIIDGRPWRRTSVVYRNCSSISPPLSHVPLPARSRVASQMISQRVYLVKQGYLTHALIGMVSNRH